MSPIGIATYIGIGGLFVSIRDVGHFIQPGTAAIGRVNLETRAYEQCTDLPAGYLSWHLYRLDKRCCAKL